MKMLLSIAVILAGMMMNADAQGVWQLDSDEFPIGMYAVGSSNNMAALAKMGVGYVHSYGLGRSADPKSIQRDLTYLDNARKHGLRVMFNLRGSTWVKKGKDGLRDMLKIVEATKDHPALGFWYFYDEPDNHHDAPDKLKPFYDAIKKATPDIPVAIAAAWSKKWDAYNDVLDILMVGCYPIQHRPFPKSKAITMTKFADEAVALGVPVMTINQCFNWKALAGKEIVYRGSPTSELRYPNREELRYWCYSGAAQGTRGMFWFAYSTSVRTDRSWINKDFPNVITEFRRFTQLTAPAHLPETFPRARDADIIMAMWRRPQGNFLVAINAWPLEQSISRWTEDKIENATLKPWGSTRDVKAKLEKGKFTIEGAANPWEVFVWEMDAR